MTPLAVPLAIRPGEHACARLERAEDRDRLTSAFLRAGLERGHKVVYLADGRDAGESMARLEALHDRVAAALAGGQLEVRSATAAYLAHGTFETRHMVEALCDEQEAALAEGYTGLSITGHTDCLSDEPWCDDLDDYESRLAQLPLGTSVFLCQYDAACFGGDRLAEIAALHEVDVSPELAAIGREGPLSAARVGHGRTLRLAGQLDFQSAPAVMEVLDGHFDGERRLDLADVSYVDVSGMRALRGRAGRSLTIAGASHPVRELVALLAWDTDPAVAVVDPP